MLRKVFNRLRNSGRPKADAGLVEADRLIAAGMHEERQGRLDLASRHFRAAISAAPAHAAPYLNLGIALEAMGNAGEAQGHYEAALRIEPANPYVNYNLGKLLYTTGDLRRSDTLVRAALAIQA